MESRGIGSQIVALLPDRELGGEGCKVSPFPGHPEASRKAVPSLARNFHVSCPQSGSQTQHLASLAALPRLTKLRFSLAPELPPSGEAPAEGSGKLRDKCYLGDQAPRDNTGLWVRDTDLFYPPLSENACLGCLGLWV